MFCIRSDPNAIVKPRCYFVGREHELGQLHTWLTPCPQYRNVVVLYKLGGMGKTQLSVQYVQRFGDRYSLVFWLNAKDEGTLKGWNG